MEGKEFKANVNGIEIAYARWGIEGNKRIMLVHGVMGYKEMWTGLALKLASENFDVIALDLRGYGDSTKPEGEFVPEMFSSDIYELSKWLKWEDGFTILGHSLGGYIALDYALKYPETLACMIVANTSAYLARTFSSKLVWKMSTWIYKRSSEKTMQKMIPNMFIRPQPKEFINEFIEKSLKTPKSVGVSAIRICLAKNLEPELIKIKVPTLIILSQQDQKNLRNAGF